MRRIRLCLNSGCRSARVFTQRIGVRNDAPRGVDMNYNSFQLEYLERILKKVSQSLTRSPNKQQEFWKTVCKKKSHEARTLAFQIQFPRNSHSETKKVLTVTESRLLPGRRARETLFKIKTSASRKDICTFGQNFGSHRDEKKARQE